MRESELEKLTRSHWRGDDATFITAWVRAGLRDAVVGKTRALEAMAQHVFTTTYPALAKQGVRWDTDGGNPIVVGHVHDLHNSVTQLCVRFDPENVRAREQAARAKADAEKQAKEKAEAERQAAEDRYRERARAHHLLVGGTEASFRAAWPGLWQNELQRRQQAEGAHNRHVDLVLHAGF